MLSSLSVGLASEATDFVCEKDSRDLPAKSLHCLRIRFTCVLDFCSQSAWISTISHYFSLPTYWLLLAMIKSLASWFLRDFLAARPSGLKHCVLCRDYLRLPPLLSCPVVSPAVMSTENQYYEGIHTTNYTPIRIDLKKILFVLVWLLSQKYHRLA